MAYILFMEDEGWQTNPTINVLRTEYGHKLTFCSTIEEADKILRKQSFEVFIGDIMMDPDGPITYETSAFVIIDDIRKGVYTKYGNPANMPIIVATGVSAMEMKWKDGDRIKVNDAISRAGIPEDCCIDKPYLAQDLANIIDRVLIQSE